MNIFLKGIAILLLFLSLVQICGAVYLFFLGLQSVRENLPFLGVALLLLSLSIFSCYLLIRGWKASPESFMIRLGISFGINLLYILIVFIGGSYLSFS